MRGRSDSRRNFIKSISGGGTYRQFYGKQTRYKTRDLVLGSRLVIINMDETAFDSKADILIRGSIADVFFNRNG